MKPSMQPASSSLPSRREFVWLAWAKNVDVKPPVNFLAAFPLPVWTRNVPVDRAVLPEGTPPENPIPAELYAESLSVTRPERGGAWA